MLYVDFVLHDDAADSQMIGCISTKYAVNLNGWKKSVVKRVNTNNDDGIIYLIGLIC